MPNVPCPSDYRSGDEFNPSSPDYESPDVKLGSERAEFSWFFYMDPPHPKLGEEVQVILLGDLEFSDVYQPLSASDKRALRHGASLDDVDQQVDRTYDGFTLLHAELPDGRKLAIKDLAAIPGFGDEKSQITDYKGELLESAQLAIDSPLKNKLELSRLREQWKQDAAPSLPMASESATHKLSTPKAV